LFYTGRKYMSTHQLLLRNRDEVENCGFVAVAVLLRWSFDFWFCQETSDLLMDD
jgi:hypothetical protein